MTKCGKELYFNSTSLRGERLPFILCYLYLTAFPFSNLWDQTVTQWKANFYISTSLLKIKQMAYMLFWHQTSTITKKEIYKKKQLGFHMNSFFFWVAKSNGMFWCNLWNLYMNTFCTADNISEQSFVLLHACSTRSERPDVKNQKKKKKLKQTTCQPLQMSASTGLLHPLLTNQ